MRLDALYEFFLALMPLLNPDLTPTDQAVKMVGRSGNRLSRFRKLNDQIWGEGNWISCMTCPRDSMGFAPFHHRNAHPQRVGVATEHSIQDPFTGEITVKVLLD